MTSTKISPNSDVTGTSIDLSTIDIEQAMQRGRRLRAEAFISILKALFRSNRVERSNRKDGFSPDCAAPV